MATSSDSLLPGNEGEHAEVHVPAQAGDKRTDSDVTMSAVQESEPSGASAFVVDIDDSLPAPTRSTFISQPLETAVEQQSQETHIQGYQILTPSPSQSNEPQLQESFHAHHEHTRNPSSLPEADKSPQECFSGRSQEYSAFNREFSSSSQELFASHRKSEDQSQESSTASVESAGRSHESTVAVESSVTCRPEDYEDVMDEDIVTEADDFDVFGGRPMSEYPRTLFDPPPRQNTQQLATAQAESSGFFSTPATGSLFDSPHPPIFTPSDVTSTEDLDEPDSLVVDDSSVCKKCKASPLDSTVDNTSRHPPCPPRNGFIQKVGHNSIEIGIFQHILHVSTCILSTCEIFPLFRLFRRVRRCLSSAIPMT